MGSATAATLVNTLHGTVTRTKRVLVEKSMMNEVDIWESEMVLGLSWFYCGC